MTDTTTTNHNATTSTRWELVIEQDQYSEPLEVYTFQLREIEVSPCRCCGASTESLVSDDGNMWETIIGTDETIKSIKNGLAYWRDEVDLDKLTIIGDAAHAFEIDDFRSTK